VVYGRHSGNPADRHSIFLQFMGWDDAGEVRAGPCNSMCMYLLAGTPKLTAEHHLFVRNPSAQIYLPNATTKHKQSRKALGFPSRTTSRTMLARIYSECPCVSLTPTEKMRRPTNRDAWL